MLGSHGETVGGVGMLRQTVKPEEGHRGVLGTGCCSHKHGRCVCEETGMGMQGEGALERKDI